MSTSRRSGFTLIEMLVVTVVGSLLVLATYETLVANRGTYTAHRLTLQGRQALTASAQVLGGALRDMSIPQGDLVAMGDSSVAIRSASSVGFACEVDQGTTPAQLRILEVGGEVADADSVLVLADNDPDRRNDDVWLTGYVTSQSPGVTCPDGSPARDLQVEGLGATNVVLPGAPIRPFEHHTWDLLTVGAQRYLSLAVAGGDPEPVVGPLGGGSRRGLSFEYFDEDGVVTTTPGDVRSIRVTLRTPVSPVGGGRTVEDSLVIRVHPRN